MQNVQQFSVMIFSSIYGGGEEARAGVDVWNKGMK